MQEEVSKRDIRQLRSSELKEVLAGWDQPGFRAKQIQEWLWKKSARSFVEMTNLSKSLRQQLADAFVIRPIRTDVVQHSQDGTIKSRFRLHDGHLIESVLIPVPADKRFTACVSSQVGCSLSCKFCATGFLNRERNLEAAEIYDQIMKEGKTPPPPPKKEIGPPPEDAPAKGAKNAKIVIQEFSDFECPFCSRVNPTLQKVLAEYGNVDILVNNAGVTKDNLLFRMSEEDWESVVATNLNSVFYWVKGLARPMTRKRWGRVINITSVSGIVGNAGQTNYSAAKAGMVGFTKSLARELASRSVTVNAVAPGFIKTDMTSKLADAALDVILPQIPLKRMGEASDIANMVTYLASEEANYITGQVFTVDGGMAM